MPYIGVWKLSVCYGVGPRRLRRRDVTAVPVIYRVAANSRREAHSTAADPILDTASQYR